MHGETPGFGAQIGSGGLISVPTNNAFQFGTGDFSVTCRFLAETAGALVSRKSASGGSPTDAGWLLILNADESFTFATDNGFGYYLVNSVPTAALDGGSHTVAAVLSGATLSLWFDGAPLATTSLGTQTPPLGISSNQRLVFGQADQPPTRQFLGVIETVSLWSRKLTPGEINVAAFGRVDSAAPGLVGLWLMDQDFTDASATGADASPNGAVSFVPVGEDYGAEIGSGGAIALSPIPAYQFGAGNFSVTCLFRAPAGGALVTSKAASGGSSAYAGWLLILNNDGSLSFIADNGFGYYLVNSVATSALDGQWHAVAAVRTGAGLAIWLDGVQLQTSPLSSQTPPLNVSSNLRILIGQADQPPTRQFVGTIEDITLWNRAITADEIQAARFNATDEMAAGLVGYWKMDGNLVDVSTNRNAGAAIGTISFVPVAHQARRSQTLAVTLGTGYLYGSVIDTSQTKPAFPAGTIMSVRRPDGVPLNQETSTDVLLVRMNGASVWAFGVANPMAGDWTFTVQATAGAPVLMSVQTTPTSDTAPTIENALAPLYSGEAHLRRVARNTDLALGWTWSDFTVYAGTALNTLAVIAGSTALAAGAAVFSPVVLGCAAALTVGYIVTEVALASQVEQSSYKIATGIGLPGPYFGGSASGSVTLLMEGAGFFPALRDLFAAVAAGSYAPSAVSIPSRPTLLSMTKLAGTAGKSVSVLLWDPLDAQYISDNNYYVSALIRQYLTQPFTINADTRTNLKTSPNVDARLESYRMYGAKRWLSSQHQKIAIVKVGGVKAALVGGLNLLGDYWDTPTHPMYPTLHSWHDAAALIQGPAVDLIEAEFDRRWRQNSGSPPSSADYAKLAYWMADANVCLDNPSVCAGSAPPTAYVNRVTGGSQYPVDVMVTNSEFAQRVTQIRDKLIAQIQACAGWAYFENYTFHDIQLIRALISRLQSTASLNLVLMLPHPTNGGVVGDGEAFLIRASLCALMLCAGEWTQLTYKTASGSVTVTRAQCSGTPAVTLPEGYPIEVGRFTYVLAADGSSHTVALTDITDLVQTSAARVIAASAARYIVGLPPDPPNQLVGLPANFRGVYIHSKAAVFDSSYALVGSANFAARSMAADGECSVGVSDPTTVAQIKSTLINHWGVNPATQNWKAAIAAFVATTTNGLGAVPLSISALAAANPMNTEMGFLYSIIDPSFLL